MSEDDLRALLNPIAAILAARPRYREVPESIYQPPSIDGGSPPEPVIRPAHTELYVDPADLPAEVVGADGEGVSLGGQLALVQSMLAWVWGEMQIRAAVGRVTLTSGGPFLAGQERDFNITWDEPPLKTPTGGVVTVHAGVAWMGKVTAVIVPGTLTVTGCTVRAAFLNTVVPSGGQPVTLEPQGLYLWVPPYGEEAA